MKPDRCNKAVLTVVALLLGVIVCKSAIHPDTTAEAQGVFAGMRFTGDLGHLVAFDTRTGELGIPRDPDRSDEPEDGGENNQNSVCRRPLCRLTDGRGEAGNRNSPTRPGNSRTYRTAFRRCCKTYQS